MLLVAEATFLSPAVKMARRREGDGHTSLACQRALDQPTMSAAQRRPVCVLRPTCSSASVTSMLKCSIVSPLSSSLRSYWFNSA